jgi:Transcriptional regulators
MEIKSGLNITDCISLINGRVETTVNRFLNRKLKENNIGITIEQWSVMATLWEHDIQTQQSICDNIYKDKASVTRLIDALEKNGFVTRQSDPKDRRINLIHLTQNGRDMEEKVNNIIMESVDVASKGISKEDFLMMTDLFRKIIKNLDE